MPDDSIIIKMADVPKEAYGDIQKAGARLARRLEKKYGKPRHSFHVEARPPEIDLAKL